MMDRTGASDDEEDMGEGDLVDLHFWSHLDEEERKPAHAQRKTMCDLLPETGFTCSLSSFISDIWKL